MTRLFQQIRFLFSKQDFTRFAILAALLISVGLLELVSLGAVPLYIGAITGQLSSSPYYRHLPSFLQRLCGNIYWFSLFFIILYLIRSAYLVTVTWLQYHIISNRNIALNGRIYQALLNAPYAYILSQPQSFLTQILTRNTFQITFTILTGLLTLTRCFFLGILTAGLILSFHFRLSFMALIFLITTCGIHMLRRSLFLKRAGTEVNRTQQQAFQTVSETLHAVPETKIYQLQEHFKTRMHRITEKNSNCEGRLLISNQILWPTLEVLTLLSLISAMLITMHLEQKTPLELAPALTLLTIALTRMKVLLSEAMLAVNSILRHREDLDQTCRIMQTLEKIQSSPCKEIPLTDFQELKLEQVDFSYSKDSAPVLKNLSFILKRGQSMGISGPTGCGKSTLLNLLLGLLDADRGAVTVNHLPMAAVRRQWQEMIGYVPQTIALFNDTILHNITLGIPDDKIDHERFQRAVEDAQLSEYIHNLPGKELTIIEDQGKNLSGGERQRIGIARALYRNPRVLIFDEATSALDNDTEQEITETIRHLQGTVTMIIVAHRLTTIRNCDFVLPLRPAAHPEKEAAMPL